jgi:hypothetical protein
VMIMIHHSVAWEGGGGGGSGGGGPGARTSPQMRFCGSFFLRLPLSPHPTTR